MAQQWLLVLVVLLLFLDWQLTTLSERLCSGKVHLGPAILPLGSRSGGAESDVIKEVQHNYAESFSPLDRVLFDRFAIAVNAELGSKSPIVDYRSLIERIDRLATGRQDAELEVSLRSKNILTSLFPPGLLPSYKLLFGKVPRLSAWMNVWVTHFTTKWLMGPSEVVEDNVLLVERCRFLETSGCVRTCVHACKSPTQDFFFEEMGLLVALKPNFTDYSCRFEFGCAPTSLEQDATLRVPCLDACASERKGMQ